MSSLDEPELFICFVCRQPKPMVDCKSLVVKGSFFKKDVCSDCLKKIRNPDGKETPNVDDSGRDKSSGKDG